MMGVINCYQKRTICLFNNLEQKHAQGVCYIRGGSGCARLVDIIVAGLRGDGPGLKKPGGLLADLCGQPCTKKELAYNPELQTTLRA